MFGIGKGNGKNNDDVEIIQEGPAPPPDPTPQEPKDEPKVCDYVVQTIPLAQRAKLTLKDPRLADVRDACEIMHRQGVPDDAVIGFHKWRIPPDNYYLIATWSPADGGRHQK